MSLVYLTLPSITALSLVLYKELSMGKCRNMESLKGKTAAVTGGNSGIGSKTVEGLARRGADKVIILDHVLGEATEELIARYPAVEFMQIDLTQPQSITACIDQLKSKLEKLDILVNNAGVLSEDMESMMRVNYLGHFQLTLGLKNLLGKAGKPRVVNVSSCFNKFGEVNLENLFQETPSNVHPELSVYLNYSNTKLMMILFTKELARRWGPLGITCVSLHPGYVRTNIFNTRPWLWRNLILSFAYLFGKSPTQGAQSSIFLSTAPGIEEKSGMHFADCRHNCWTRVWTHSKAEDEELASKLYEESDRLLSIIQMLLRRATVSFWVPGRLIISAIIRPYGKVTSNRIRLIVRFLKF